VWTSNDTGPHTDMAMPVNWVKANVPSDERRVEIVDSFQVFIDVAAEVLPSAGSNNTTV